MYTRNIRYNISQWYYNDWNLGQQQGWGEVDYGGNNCLYWWETEWTTMVNFSVVIFMVIGCGADQRLWPEVQLGVSRIREAVRWGLMWRRWTKAVVEIWLDEQECIVWEERNNGALAAVAAIVGVVGWEEEKTECRVTCSSFLDFSVDYFLLYFNVLSWFDWMCPNLRCWVCAHRRLTPKLLPFHLVWGGW